MVRGNGTEQADGMLGRVCRSRSSHGVRNVGRAESW